MAFRLRAQSSIAPPCERLIERIPAATAALKKSKMLRAAMGDEVIDHYVHAAEWEQQDFDRHVTDYVRALRHVQTERLERILGCVRAGATMGKADRE